MVTEAQKQVVVLWFEADGQPWKLVSLTANKAGVFRCENLLSGRTGYFPWAYVSRSTIA